MHGGEAVFFRAGAARSKAPCRVGAEISEGFFGEPARIAPEIRYTGQRR